MEHNVNATDAGAALRTGLGEHTLSVGDRDVTLMINGGRVELQRLALEIAAQAGLKISVGGFVEGAEAYRALSNDHKALTAEAQRLASQLRRAEDENQRLRTEGSPGVMHEVDAAFCKLAITERDHARVQVERLTQEIAELKGGKS